MTPFAMKLVRAYAGQANGATMALRMCGATCFDVTPVYNVIVATIDELAKGHVVRGEDPHVDHGGLLFLPDEIVWIEFRGKSGDRTGALLHQVEDQIAFTAVNPRGEPLVGFFELHDDGTFVIRHDLRQAGSYTDSQQGAAEVGAFLSAALMLINAPRGIKRVTSEPHKGLARELKRLGKPGLRPYHVIRLDKNAGHVGGYAGGAPKAFHFCRAHVRRLSADRTTKVRAHWRGDPALGICRGDYEVAA